MEPLFELKVTTAPPGSREVASHLFKQLKAAIAGGRLPAGARLPSTRDAPRMFGVSRNTAQDVYDRLTQEGLLTPRHGSGTFVSCRSDSREQTRPESEQAPEFRLNPFWHRPETSAWIGFWHERSASDEATPIVADLRPALVDQNLFPHAVFRQVMARQLRRLETQPASTRSPQRNQGNGRLRHAIADHVGVTRAIACRPDDLVVTSGAQQAFDLLARTLVVAGHTTVAVEDPGYPPMRVPFAAAGARLVPVPVDGEGMMVEAIPADARIICVCPSHQFPLGMPMSSRRRRALLAFARRNDAVIVEDDYDGEFRYDGSPLEALRGQSGAANTFYVGSFSKCMFPAIRLGFLIAPQWAMPALVAAKNASDWHNPVPVQAAVDAFIRDGHLTRHIGRVRRIYRSRRDHLLELLATRLGGELTAIPSYYGMHVAALARPGVDCDSASAALAARGIMVHSLARYHLGPQTRSGFIIAFAAADREEIEMAVSAMADILKNC